MDTALCPACFSSQLEPQPTVIRPEPPELILAYEVTPTQVRENFNRWLKGVWLRPKELNPAVLTHRLTRTFVPMWLVDCKLSGQWQAQMGFDYQVASSQEVYRGSSWTTRKLTETRIRWEPRAGTAERTYQNLSVPALEEHARLMRGLGNYRFNEASNYAPESLGRSSVRVPSLLPEAAWPQAKSGLDHLTAQDCQTAAKAQHFDEFSIHADYQDLHWTQLLLPVYTTAYRDEDGTAHPILINGQNGKIYGLKRASQRLARNWSLGLGAIALLCFVLGLLFAAGAGLIPILGVISMFFFGLSLLVGVSAPIPAFWAWDFNRQKEDTDE
jgi:hypothetical protein